MLKNASISYKQLIKDTLLLQSIYNMEDVWNIAIIVKKWVQWEESVYGEFEVLLSS